MRKTKYVTVETNYFSPSEAGNQYEKEYIQINKENGRKRT